MLKVDKFYFGRGGTFNTIQLIEIDDQFATLVITNGWAQLEGLPNAETTIPVLPDDHFGRNIQQMKKFHEALGKMLEGKKVPKKDSVRSKIRTRHSYVKPLSEYISMVELCVVEFENNTAAYVGEYIELLTGSDCLFLDEILDTENLEYDVTSLAIGKKAMEYFKSVHGEIPTKCYFISNSNVLEAIKLRLNDPKN